MLLNGIGDTVANLKEAWGGEDHEVESMYPTFEKEAEEEGEKRACPVNIPGNSMIRPIWMCD